MESYLVSVYVVYALIGVSLTIWLARVLAKNGAVFLRDVFADNPDMAEAVNRLLVVGFYLFNLGYAALILKADPAQSMVAAIETLAWKLGLLLLSLAAMHFTNLFIFHRIRRRAQEPKGQPPVPPQGYYPAMAGGYGGQYVSGYVADKGHSAFDLIERQAEREDALAAELGSPAEQPA